MIELIVNDRRLIFDPVDLHFEDAYFENVFAGKNNKTLKQTLSHPRYMRLEAEVYRKFPQYLDWKLGDFVLFLKNNKDKFYLKFLNKYGDLLYSRFFITEDRYLNQKGIYLYTASDKLVSGEPS